MLQGGGETAKLRPPQNPIFGCAQLQKVAQLATCRAIWRRRSLSACAGSDRRGALSTPTSANSINSQSLITHTILTLARRPPGPWLDRLVGRMIHLSTFCQSLSNFRLQRRFYRHIVHRSAITHQRQRHNQSVHCINHLHQGRSSTKTANQMGTKMASGCLHPIRKLLVILTMGCNYSS